MSQSVAEYLVSRGAGRGSDSDRDSESEGDIAVETDTNGTTPNSATNGNTNGTNGTNGGTNGANGTAPRRGIIRRLCKISFGEHRNSSSQRQQQYPHEAVSTFPKAPLRHTWSRPSSTGFPNYEIWERDHAQHQFNRSQEDSYEGNNSWSSRHYEEGDADSEDNDIHNILDGFYSDGEGEAEGERETYSPMSSLTWLTGPAIDEDSPEGIEFASIHASVEEAAAAIANIRVIINGSTSGSEDEI